MGSKYHHLYVIWLVFFLVSKSIVRHVHVFSASSIKFSTKSMKDTLSKNDSLCQPFLLHIFQLENSPI
jgi:hypothetical protein